MYDIYGSQWSWDWNFRASFPQLHHPVIKFRAKISRALYSRSCLFIRCSNRGFRFGFRECKSGTPIITFLFTSFVSAFVPFFPMSNISYGFLQTLLIGQIGSPLTVTFSHIHSSISFTPHSSKSPLVPRISSRKEGLLVIQTATKPSSSR